MRYYIYNKSKLTGIVRYWDRRQGMWSKWFNRGCHYNTEIGVKRIYNKLINDMNFDDVIGWKAMEIGGDAC